MTISNDGIIYTLEFKVTRHFKDSDEAYILLGKLEDLLDSKSFIHSKVVKGSDWSLGDSYSGTGDLDAKD